MDYRSLGGKRRGKYLELFKVVPSAVIYIDLKWRLERGFGRDTSSAVTSPEGEYPLKVGVIRGSYVEGSTEMESSCKEALKLLVLKKVEKRFFLRNWFYEL